MVLHRPVELAAFTRWHWVHFLAQNPVPVYRQDALINAHRGGETGFPSVAASMCVYKCVLTIDGDRKSTRLNSSHSQISYAVFCLKTQRRTASASRCRLRPYALCQSHSRVPTRLSRPCPPPPPLSVSTTQPLTRHTLHRHGTSVTS